MTRLQFQVLAILLEGEQSGRSLRAKLAEEGERKSGPAFYQMMARLEDAKWVEGWYEQKTVEGQAIKERRYKITGSGATAWEAIRNFYAERAKEARRFGKGFATA
jgi:DNA-binding PadR family transcriptional regulator